MDHKQASGSSLSFSHWLCELTGTVYDKLHNRADGAILDSDHRVRPTCRRQFNGQDLKRCPLVRNFSAEDGKTVMNRPVSSKLTRIWGESVTTVARGYSNPLARKACVMIDPITLSRGGSTQRSSARSELDVAPPSPGIFRTGRDDIAIFKKKLEIQPLVSHLAAVPHDQQIDFALAQVAVQCLYVARHELKFDPRMTPGEPIYESGDEARGQKGRASNPHFSSGGVGQKFDALHTPA